MKNFLGEMIMKKILVCLLVVILAISCAVSLFACKNNEEVIVVGITDYEPMNYKDASGNWTGFDTELAIKVFEELGYKVVFKEIQWEQKYTELEAGTIQCIWNGFTSNGSDEINGVEVPRSESVDFSYDYMINKQCIVVKAADKDSYTSVDTSFVEKIGVAEAGSAGFAAASDFAGVADVKEATSQRTALQEVLAGSASFAVIDILMAKAMVGSGDFASLAIADSIELEGEQYAVGFKRGSELTAKVNAELEKLGESGYLTELATKYNLQNSVITDYSSQK